jgi:predicted transcriptional regulator
MDSINLRDDLRETLEKSAEFENKNVDEIVNEAVEEYVRSRQREKLNREIIAYEAMHNELYKKYRDQWVAIHAQELVDHDKDGLALYSRVRNKYGRTSVLIRQVTQFPMEEIWFRTPHTGKSE